MKRTIGGNRLGSGSKMEVDLRTYNRSNFNKDYIWRSSIAAGTLVPFMSEVALPGDSYDINLDVDIKTLPTIGPLFGSFKIQLDVFMCPIRLYQGLLHNNKLGIGLDMSKVKLPQLVIEADLLDVNKPVDNQQINPSCVLNYLGIRGLGQGELIAPSPVTTREFNALPLISYWDIYKNYYANKQENIGVVISNDVVLIKDITGAWENTTGIDVTIPAGYSTTPIVPTFNIGDNIYFAASTLKSANEIKLWVKEPWEISARLRVLSELPFTWSWIGSALEGVCTVNNYTTDIYGWTYNEEGASAPKLVEFNLENLDEMRENLQSHLTYTPYIIDDTAIAPYGMVLQKAGSTYKKLNAQEGLAIKTYQSDMFNNWMSTEWIDGVNGINEITAVDTSGGSFEIDALNLAKKVYDMLNRIAISGGTYNDWIDTVYTSGSIRKADSPIYMGGLSRELVFQEVFSTSETNGQPLGTLAGRGRMGERKKGGNVSIKVDEPSYIIGIISLTPRIDYSQGNRWDVNLKSVNDFHKPALDEIGFQDLVTDQMAFWDTTVDNNGNVNFRSAGLQPAWINYMTDVNRTYGNFAIQEKEMFMTLNRRYEFGARAGGILIGIKDLTTYIDPVKYNYIFAETNLDAQNFWAQIAVNMKPRRMMSSKIMPNL